MCCQNGPSIQFPCCSFNGLVRTIGGKNFRIIFAATTELEDSSCANKSFLKISAKSDLTLRKKKALKTSKSMPNAIVFLRFSIIGSFYQSVDNIAKKVYY